MKARTESTSESAYDNSFEAVIPSKLPLPNRHSRELRDDDVRKAVNGYAKSNGAVQRNGASTRCNYPLISDGGETDLHQPQQQQQPLHFDTQEILEETPAIFKSLNSSIRGPDTFVYLSSLKSGSNDEDPCKTFVISSDDAEFVSRKNCLNQTSALSNGFGNPTNTTDNNEYLSYVIEKDNEPGCKGTMNESKAKAPDVTDLGKRDEGDAVDGVIVPGSQRNQMEKGVRNATSDAFDKKNSTQCKNVAECETCDSNVQSNGQNSSPNDAAVLSFDRTIADRKEQAFAKLQDELEKAHLELKLKDEEVTRLTRIREDVERELEELTASLFQEAHKMVSNAKEKQAAAEKNLAESQMKVDVLTAEVVALKTLVLTSTPSRPNPHLHPQIGKEESNGGVNLFNRKHRRSPSHFNLKYGRENSPPDSPVREKSIVNNAAPNPLENRDISEVDPTVHKEFLNWSLNCKLDKTDPFIDRIYREDINLCLDFSNRELSEEVQKAIETRNIFIEALTDKSKTIFPRKCALLEVTRQCHYRMKLGDQDIWYNISQMCRNRIIAVCDFINYLRYIELGLVKSSAHDMYWEIMRLRKEMILARLGLSSPSS